MGKGFTLLAAAVVFMIMLCCAAAGAEDAHTHWCYCDQVKDGCVCEACGKKVSAEEIDIRHQLIHMAFDHDYHWWVCKRCEEKVDPYPHWANCDQPDVCAGCGKTDVLIEYVSHECDQEKAAYDSLTHWWVCGRCGEKVDQYAHGAYCDTPDVCATCGAKNVTMQSISHRYDWAPHSDQTSHWFICSKCGKAVEQGPHWARCDQPDVCAVCGKKDVVFESISHTYDRASMQYNKEAHWYACSKCGEKAAENVHWAYCGTPDVCAECGAKDVAMEYVSHDFERQSDAAYHWLTCKVCGEEREKGAHKVYCTAPGVCGICGEPCEGEVFHVHPNPDDSAIYDETYHQFACENGHGLVLEKHEFIDGVCQLCGYGREAALKGDANGDGAVDGRDALRLARYLAGISIAIDWEAADVNGDGGVDGRDLLLLAKRLGGN